MGFTTIVKPRLAERWRKQGELGRRDFLRNSRATGGSASGPRGVRRRARAHHLRRAQGQGGALRRLPAADRHRARRRRHHPAAEPHRLSDRVLRAGADRRHRQQGQPRLPRCASSTTSCASPAAAPSSARRRSRGSTTSAWRIGCARQSLHLTHVIVAGGDIDGGWNLEHGHRRDASSARRKIG